jgi:hypothetical protein
MIDFSQDEFAALRATIRERGTARVWIFFVAIAGWAAIVTTMALAGSARLHARAADRARCGL